MLPSPVYSLWAVACRLLSLSVVAQYQWFQIRLTAAYVSRLEGVSFECRQDRLLVRPRTELAFPAGSR